MTLELIDSPSEIDAELGCQFDVQVSAHFLALYRCLQLQSTSEKPLRALGITSCRRGEGVSTVAACLAVAAAEHGEKKVLLVDASPHEHSVHRGYELGTPGLLNFAKDSHTIAGARQSSILPNLWMLPAGADAPAASALESVIVTGGLAEFSFIVVDLPHVEQLGDAVRLATALDGVVLVVDAEHTGWAQVQSAAETLSPVRLLGAVMNKRYEHPDSHTDRQS